MAFTSNVPVPTIDATGCHIPAFADVYAGLVADYQSVYGSDVVLSPDTQDGQWLGIMAAAFNDHNAAFLAAYNARSPVSAQGVGLSSVVKLNGLTRETASYSVATVTLVGQASIVLTNCQARDEAGYLWALPVSVTIPLSGQIDVTATCTTLGAISAPAGSIDQIATPTLGWQSVSNANAATPGEPVETDPELRVRQSQSTALPSKTILEGAVGAILALPNIVRVRPYENDGDAPDANGIPGHSVSLVIDGGDAQAIAQVLAAKKGSTGTYGSTVVSVSDALGISRDVRFFRPSEPVITWAVTLKPLMGYTVDVAAAIQQALSDWTNALGIGTSILLTRAYLPANLYGTAQSSAFEVQSIAVARDGASPASADVPIAFNEAPLCVPANVTITTTS